MEVKASVLITSVRFIAVSWFLYSSFAISWQAVISLCVVIGTIFLKFPKRRTSFHVSEIEFKENPLKGKPRISFEDLDSSIRTKLESDICSFCTYDASNVESLQRFATVYLHTECIFAKKAKLWGSLDWSDDISVQNNIAKIAPTFLKFTLLCQHLGLDGFVIEIPEKYGTSVEVFGGIVRSVLREISKLDPMKNDSMNKSYIDKPGWVFRFHKETFFITTFAPCYPTTNSRYSFSSECAYILLQPEISFAQHDIPLDTEETNWSNPKTVRDKIRVAFRNAGREYKLYPPGRPMVYDIVKPVDDSDFVEWWKVKSE